MKVSELRDRLVAEGCNENNFAVRSRGSDAWCIDRRGDEWVVFYSERGSDSAPVFRSASEDDACAFFVDLVMRQRHWHLVGFFRDEADARALEHRLTGIGVAPIRNDIPAYRGAGDPRHRVFVAGRDILRVRERLGDLPIDHA